MLNPWRNQSLRAAAWYFSHQTSCLQLEGRLILTLLYASSLTGLGFDPIVRRYNPDIPDESWYFVCQVREPASLFKALSCLAKYHPCYITERGACGAWANNSQGCIQNNPQAEGIDIGWVTVPCRLPPLWNQRWKHEKIGNGRGILSDLKYAAIAVTLLKHNFLHDTESLWWFHLWTMQLGSCQWWKSRQLARTFWLTCTQQNISMTIGTLGIGWPKFGRRLPQILRYTYTIRRHDRGGVWLTCTAT